MFEVGTKVARKSYHPNGFKVEIVEVIKVSKKFVWTNDGGKYRHNGKQVGTNKIKGVVKPILLPYIHDKEQWEGDSEFSPFKYDSKWQNIHRFSVDIRDIDFVYPKEFIVNYGRQFIHFTHKSNRYSNFHWEYKYPERVIWDGRAENNEPCLLTLWNPEQQRIDTSKFNS